MVEKDTRSLEERLEGNIKVNCGTCCHKEVCSEKERYKAVVNEIIHKLSTDFDLVECALRCGHHMFLGGTSYDRLFGKTEELKL